MRASRERMWCLWRDAMDAKLASPIETPKDAYAKLWWACYWIGLGADEDLSPLSRRLLRVGSAIRVAGLCQGLCALGL